MNTILALRSVLARALLILSCAVSLVAAIEHDAHAYTGWVTGHWSVWLNTGNSCPPNADCTGALFRKSQNDIPQDVSNAAIWVQDPDGNTIGSGYTDVHGYYTLQWQSTFTFPGTIRVGVQPSHSRFSIRLPNGSSHYSMTAVLATSHTSTLAAPQNVGAQVIGSSTLPDPYFNSFWAMEWLYRGVLSYIGVFQINFTGIEVRAYANSVANFAPLTNPCPSSCTDGASKRVILDANAMFSPQMRDMHELGHIATYWSKPWQATTDYTLGGGTTWNVDTAEYGMTSFEEAMATHYGSVAWWSDFAVRPTTCYVNSGNCYDGSGNPAVDTDIELSGVPNGPGGGNFCVFGSNPEAKWPLSIMRFLWDVYDNHVDTADDNYSAHAGSFWQHMSLMQFYASGTGLYQSDEPWNAAKTIVTEKYGRAATSYSYNYSASAGLPNIEPLRVENCSPW